MPLTTAWPPIMTTAPPSGESWAVAPTVSERLRSKRSRRSARSGATVSPPAAMMRRLRSATSSSWSLTPSSWLEMFSSKPRCAAWSWPNVALTWPVSCSKASSTLVRAMSLEGSSVRASIAEKAPSKRSRSESALASLKLLSTKLSPLWSCEAEAMPPASARRRMVKMRSVPRVMASTRAPWPSIKPS